MNIYLIGMMGSGKSSTGKALAKTLGCAFIDLDEALETKSGRTISEIFQKEGEPYFRNEESKILQEMSGQGPAVMATGGGIVLRPENIKQMKTTGQVIYLKTSIDWLWKRVQKESHRPLLKVQDPRAALEKILNDRRDLYEKAGDLALITDGKTPDEVAETIRAHLNKVSSREQRVERK